MAGSHWEMCLTWAVEDWRRAHAGNWTLWVCAGAAAGIYQMLCTVRAEGEADAVSTYFILNFSDSIYLLKNKKIKCVKCELTLK